MFEYFGEVAKIRGSVVSAVRWLITLLLRAVLFILYVLFGTYISIHSDISLLATKGI
jgi:hypothetical protein